MPAISPKALIGALNPTCRRALEAALGLCVARTHFHTELEHWLLALLDAKAGDLPKVLSHYDADPNQVRRELDRALATFKTGNGRTPDLSPDIFDLVRESWVLASLGLGSPAVRSGHVLSTLLSDRNLGPRIKLTIPELAKVPAEKLGTELGGLLANIESEENAPAPGPLGSAPAPGTANAQTPSLDQYTVNLSERAKKGEIDPVVGRDAEIRQLIDILLRRRQNNPILTGEAGVGKTAVVEGLALRIAAGDVPDPLKPVVLRTLDLGLLQAGAGVKGEFENRLKSVLQEVKQSSAPVILFIDEAHTLIGAGGPAGQGDAANLLKPALARGELRTVAATTFDEYKKYFESDPALKRRFQEVRVDEPDEAKAVRMLRGVVAVLEKHHGVRVLDEALAAAVQLGVRYLPERQLPDKAISLLDTACARVKLSQSATPAALDDTVRELEALAAEIAAVGREEATGADVAARLADLRQKTADAEAKKAMLTEQLGKERGLVEKVRELVGKLTAPDPADPAARDELAKVRGELAGVQGESPLVYPVVDAGAVTQVVAGWTGIPVGKMVHNELQTVLTLQDRLAARVVGQDDALYAIAERIRTSRADLADPRRPVGVFLLVGPSGVGKTETALALADLLYGGDRNMVVINMSEFKEEYKVSQLIGSPRGYEGSSEGGVLTEAVRRRPYAVVLLDEVEKAHPSVNEIFYQVFDKGVLTDSRGVEVNFKNTVILLTSNAGTDEVMRACASPEGADSDDLQKALRPALLRTFKPALLGRMVVVPYFPLTPDVLRRIIELQLGKIGDRLRANHKATFSYDPAVVDVVAARCTEVESGARNVDHILTGTVLPALAGRVLERLAEGKPVTGVTLGVGEGSEFTYEVT